MRNARAEFPARASSLVLHMQPLPRQVCLAGGGDILDHSDVVKKISGILRNYFPPEAVDAIRRQVMRFTRSRRTDQPIGDLLCRGAESKMEMAAGSPDQFVSICRMDNADPPRHEKSLVMARCYKSLRFADASANMRRLPC